MSFCRIKYDNDAYDLRIGRATGPGDYRLFSGTNENCKTCFSYNGPRNTKSDVSIASHNSNNQWPAMTDVESLLTNRVNKLIDYNSYGKNDAYKLLQTTDKNICSDVLVTEDTRFTNPIEAYRCMDLTSYHYSPFLYVNNQCEIQDDRIGSSSRLKVKDQTKPAPRTPIDEEPYPSQNEPIIVDACKNF
jgi:hypothetical protein